MGHYHKDDDKLTKSAKAYINLVVPEILQTWSPEKLQKQASPRLIEFIKLNASYTHRYEELKKMGALRNMSIDSGSIYKVKTINNTTETLGNFKLHADFEKVSATVTVRLIFVDDQWKILGFEVITPIPLR